RDHVDGAAHQRALDHAAVDEGLGEVVPGEPCEPGPQADVAGRCVLGLEPTNLLHSYTHGEGAALEQLLAGQERPVEHPPGEGLLGHGAAGGPSIRSISSSIAAQTVREKGTSSNGSRPLTATATTVSPVQGTFGQVAR